MSASHLVVFPSQGEPESPADRIRRLQLEAKGLAGEIAEGGELYPVGARELSRRLTDDANNSALTLTAIIDRK
jgi:hypothetical protein